jgi:hypothetical protein
VIGVNRFWGGLLLLLSFGLQAQSEITISGDALVSGTADAQIRTFVRAAAQKGQSVSISAPGYWHEQVREQVDAAAPAITARYTDVFNELVILRAEDKVAPVAAAPEPPAEPPKPAAPPPPSMAAPAVTIEKPAVEAMPIPAPAPAIAAAATPPPPAVVDLAAQKRELAITRFNEGLNDGAPITGRLKLTDLARADRLLVSDGAVAVVRDLRLRREVFILDEPLGYTNRIELMKVSDNVFEVKERFSTARETPPPEEKLDEAQELRNFELRLNGGKPFVEKIAVTAFSEGDVLYVGQYNSVILRQGRIRLERFLVDGKVDISKLRVQLQATNRYKLLSIPR